MPAYPHPPKANVQPHSQARVRAWLTRCLALGLRGERGRKLAPSQLATARILIIRPDHLGDLLLLGPALRWLRDRLPQAHITLAVGPWSKAALPGLAGAYDEYIEIPFPAFEREKRASVATRWQLLWHWGRQIKSRRYHAAIIARPDHWWGAMLAHFANIPLRLGFDTPETKPWLSQTIPRTQEHTAASNLRLIATLTNDRLQPNATDHPLSFHLTSRELGEADKLLFDIFGVDDIHPLTVIHPGAGAAVKLWTPEKWRDIASQLVKAGVRVVVTGSSDETSMTRTVASAPSGNVIDLGGQTKFGALAALLHRADLVMGPDSGVLHLAVAVNTPTVHLYGPADPALFGPWGDPAQHITITSPWECAPCGKLDWPDVSHHACVRDIPTESVLAAAWQLLHTHF